MQQSGSLEPIVRDRSFLYLAHNSPHIPYTARPDLIARSTSAFEPVYAALIETLDAAVGRLVAKIDALGLSTNTIIIFTSDNGGLHVPELKHERITHNGRFRAGKGFVYEGGLRIPLIVRWPGTIPARRVVDAPVINTDWLPTLLDCAGLPRVEGLDGEKHSRFAERGGQARHAAVVLALSSLHQSRWSARRRGT
jgi:arylsulfatase A